MSYIGTSPFCYPHYAFAKDRAMAINGLAKNFQKVNKLSKFKKNSKRIFIIVCPDCLTEIVIKDVDLEVICPVCSETEDCN